MPSLRCLIVLFCFSGLVLAADTIIRVIPLKHRPAQALQQIIAPLLTDDERVIANADSLILKTTPGNLPTLLSLIKKLDTPPAQFVIQVMQRRGITAKQLQAELQAKSGNSSQPHGYLHGKFADTRTLQNQNSLQTLRTLEGKPAIIKIGENRPYYHIRLWNYGYGQPGYDVETQWIEITTGFSVIPHLAGKKIQLVIQPWSRHLENTQAISIQQAATTLIIPPNQWVAIGEIASTDNDNQTGFLQHTRSTQQDRQTIFIKVKKLP